MSPENIHHKDYAHPDAPSADSGRRRLLPKSDDRLRLIVISVIIGVAAGTGAALLKWMISHTASLLRLLSFGDGPDWTVLWLPVVGIVLTGIYQRYILRRKISHGVDALVNDLARGDYSLSPRLTYAPMVASTLTLGFGGSAGAEGPIAYAGAAMGSNLGRLCGVSRDTLYTLIGCGAAAGIAGIFKAPVGGAMFALEVLGLTMTTVSVIALFAATISAALACYMWMDFTLDLTWSHNIGFEPSMLLWVIPLGAFCGLYSVYYSMVMRKMKDVYGSIRNPWLMNVASGAVLAVMIFVFPALYGEGYGVMGRIINMDWSPEAGVSVLTDFHFGHLTLLLVTGGVLLVKCFACSAANCGGGVAGDFAPTLFAGCFAGLFFALAARELFGLDFPIQVVAYIGMAGVMAGVIRAPLMATFLTAEMCNGFDYILPLIVVTLMSYAMVMLVTRRKFYTTHFMH